MKKSSILYFLFVAILFCWFVESFGQENRTRLIDSNWRFHLGDVCAANNPEFIDAIGEC
jgi:hypothetical protein